MTHRVLKQSWSLPSAPRRPTGFSGKVGARARVLPPATPQGTPAMLRSSTARGWLAWQRGTDALGHQRGGRPSQLGRGGGIRTLSHSLFNHRLGGTTRRRGPPPPTRPPLLRSRRLPSPRPSRQRIHHRPAHAPRAPLPRIVNEPLYPVGGWVDRHKRLVEPRRAGVGAGPCVVVTDGLPVPTARDRTTPAAKTHVRTCIHTHAHRRFFVDSRCGVRAAAPARVGVEYIARARRGVCGRWPARCQTNGNSSADCCNYVFAAT